MLFTGVWSHKLNAHICQVYILQFGLIQLLPKLNQTVAEEEYQKVHC